MWDHSNQEQLLSSSQNEKALWRRNHSPTWLRSINLMSGCTCRLFIPVCTEGWLRYAKFTSQNSLAFSLKVIADWILHCCHSSFYPSRASPWDSRPVSGTGVAHHH
uniref:Uncharacterized protein n=1 Tax=Cyprinus carpio TaxID=7962 RepID=A0A8C2A9R2_CYPCA